MKRPESRTARNRSSSSGMSGAYCAFTSMSGICCVTRASLASGSLLPGSSGAGRILGDATSPLPHAAPDEPRDRRDHDRRDEVVDVMEPVLEVFPARAE